MEPTVLWGMPVHCKMAPQPWKIVWQFLKRLNTVIMGPSNSISMYTSKRHVHAKTHTRMFIAAIFITARRWTQPKHSSVNEWIHKVWCILAMDYYRAIKRCEFLIHATTRTNLKHILSERNQSEKTVYYVTPLLWNVQTRHICRDRKQISHCLEQGEGGRTGRGVTA